MDTSTNADSTASETTANAASGENNSAHNGLPKGLALLPDGKTYYLHLLFSETGSSRSEKELVQMLLVQFQKEQSAIRNLASQSPSLITLLSEENTAVFPLAEPEEMLSDLQARMKNDFPVSSPVPTVIANLSASDETVGKAEYRRALVSNQSARLLCGYLYASAGHGESTQDMVFAGHDLIAENGALLAETSPFEGGWAETELDCQRMESERARNTSFEPSAEGYLTVDFDLALTETKLSRWVDPTPFIPHDERRRAERCELILKMQADGLAKRLEHAHAKTAVIGISGGLDSCLALLVAVRAMKQLGRPTSDVLAVTMPCFGTTHRTRSNAEILCDELAVSFTEIDIANTVHSHFKDIGQDESVLDVTFENGQARVRTLELMDTANRTGGLVVGTGDLSELALGWATYNGDHMSMYGVNAGVPKTLVRHLVQYEADIAASAELRRVLLDILDTPVSPELLPAKDGEISQKTEDLVGPYELHDFYLYYVLRFGFGPSKIFRLAKAAFAGRAEYPDEVLYKWLRNFYWRFFAQQFKRSCLPDGPKVGSVTLSPRGDWRMPSDAAAALWLAELEQIPLKG